VHNEHGAADKKYGQAIGSYDRPLMLAPDSTSALNDKGNTLQQCANLRISIGDEAGADEYRGRLRRCRSIFGESLGRIDRSMNTGKKIVPCLNTCASRRELSSRKLFPPHFRVRAQYFQA
jgi:hypothetical protein